MLIAGCGMQNSEKNLSEDLFLTAQQATSCISKLDMACLNEMSAKEIEPVGGSLKCQAKTAYYYIKKYHNQSVGNLKYLRDTAFDELGRLRYTVPIFQGFDSLTGAKNVRIEIFIGPLDVYGANKISDLQVISDLDVDYRDMLYRQNRLRDMDDLISDLNR